MQQFSISEINFLHSLLIMLKKGDGKYSVNEYLESENYDSIIDKCKIELEHFKEKKSIDKFINDESMFPPKL